MGRTLIGCGVSQSPNKLVVNRTCGSGNAIACEESQIVSDSGIVGWHYGANRKHYLFMDEPWLLTPQTESKTYISGHATGDFENNRLPVTSHKLSGFTWAQVGVASSTVNVAAYNQIVARGGEIAAWQAAHAGLGKWGSTFVWTFHHEPNNETGQGSSVAQMAANWLAATSNIYNIWVSEGVQIWSGLSDWTTTQEGLILAVNLVAGGNNLGGHDSDIFSWWGPISGAGAGNTWMDQHCVMYATDPYNSGPTGNQSFKRFSFSVDTPGVKQWADAKKVYQESQGRPFMIGLFETGTQIASAYTQVHPSWAATGLAATPENWMVDTCKYVRDTWTDLTLFAYYDETGSGTFSTELDASVALWNASVVQFTSPIFNSALTPLPTGESTATTELGMVW